MAKFILLLTILSVLMVFGNCQSDDGIKFQKVSITSSGRIATVEEIQANFHIVENLLLEWDDWTIALLDGGKLEGKEYGGKVQEGDFNKQVEDNIIGEKIITIESQKEEIKEMKETREVKNTSQAVPEDCCIDRVDYCICRESGESWYCDSVSSWDHHGCKNCTCSNGEVNITGDPCPPLKEPHWGNWGPWTRWRSCSATCGLGTKTRQRRCRGGRAGWELHCKGEATQTKTCRRQPCGCCYSKNSDWVGGGKQLMGSAGGSYEQNWEACGTKCTNNDDCQLWKFREIAESVGWCWNYAETFTGSAKTTVGDDITGRTGCPATGVYGKLQCKCIDAPLCPCEVKCDGACFDQVGPDDTARCFSYISCVQQK